MTTTMRTQFLAMLRENADAWHAGEIDFATFTACQRDTWMGHRFYEAPMPKIADQLERLYTNLEALVAELRLSNGRSRETSSEPATPTNPPARASADEACLLRPASC